MRDFSPISRPKAASADWSVRRLVTFFLIMSPVIALLALLSWGVLRPNADRGGLLEYNDSGEVAVEMRPAPPFDGTDLLTAEHIDNAAVSGNVVMVDFFSSWCIACKVEARALAEVYGEYEGQPVEFVGIAVWDVLGDTTRHIDRYAVPYPNILDARGVTAVSYGVRGVPEKFFLDRQGQIVRRMIGPIDPDDLREIIDELLAAETAPAA